MKFADSFFQVGEAQTGDVGYATDDPDMERGTYSQDIFEYY